MSAKQVKISKTATNLQTAMIAACVVRREHIVATDPANANQPRLWENLQKQVENEVFARRLTLALRACDLSEFARVLPQTDKKAKAGFVAIYAAQKVVRAVEAIALRDLSKFDGYTQQIVFNALRNGCKLSAMGALMSLSRSFEYDELSATEKLSRGNVAATTASTQRSSTRELLRLLGLATINKGTRNETIEIAEDKRELLRECFGLAEASETEPVTE